MGNKVRQIDFSDKPYCVYLIPFKDGEYFKFGMSRRLINRVLGLNRIYDLDIKNAKFFRFSEENKALILERLISKIVPIGENCPYKREHNIIEAREMKYFDFCRSEAKFFCEKLDGENFFFWNIKEVFNESMLRSNKKPI